MFFRLRASGNTTSADDGGNSEKFWAIVEVVVMIFITTFIPSLIELGRPPQSLDELWIPFLVALLMSAYAYMRMRGIEPTPEPE